MDSAAEGRAGPNTTAQANGSTNNAQGTTTPGLKLIKTLDTNKDSVIDANEINNATNALKKLDFNHDGKLTEGEYLYDTEARPSLSPLVRALDINHDGIIDPEEIKQASMSLRLLDKNFDGRLTLTSICCATKRSKRFRDGEGKVFRKPSRSSQHHFGASSPVRLLF